MPPLAIHLSIFFGLSSIKMLALPLYVAYFSLLPVKIASVGVYLCLANQYLFQNAELLLSYLKGEDKIFQSPSVILFI